MTIAAGFKGQDGIVICADSQESGKDFKRKIVKLEFRPKERHGDERCVAIFTGAGTGSFVDKLIDEMWKAAEQCASSRLEDIVNSMEAANLAYHQKAWGIYPPGYKLEYLPEADLLFGIWTQDRMGLYKAEGYVFNEVTGYDTVGCGTELARYICDPIYTFGYPMGFLVPMAIFMLEQVKEHVEGCGGDSHVAILENTGRALSMASIDASGIARYLKTFDLTVQQLMIASANLHIPDEVFLGLVNVFRDQLSTARQQELVRIATEHMDANQIAQTMIELRKKHLPEEGLDGNAEKKDRIAHIRREP